MHQIPFILHIVATLWQRRPSMPARRAEQPLHAATDHADLKRLVEAQSRRAALPWWPGTYR
jgi:hypothetical protein